MKHPEPLSEIKSRAEWRMAEFDLIPKHLRPLIWATNDDYVAHRLYQAGARTFEEAEALVPMLRHRS
jgi:hypothetical protein